MEWGSRLPVAGGPKREIIAFRAGEQEKLIMKPLEKHLTKMLK
jgi:hypothetical protein